MPNRVTYTFLLKNQFSAAARKIRASTAKVKSNIRLLRAEVNKTSTSMAGLVSSMKLIGGLAIAAGLASSIRVFGNLEEGIENVLTLLDDPKEIPAMRQQFRGMTEDALRLGFTIEDSTKALFDNVSALGTGTLSTKAFVSAQKLAVGGVAPLSTAVAGIAAIVNAYGRDITDADEVANAFFTAQKKGTTTVELLAANIGKVAPIAKAAGVGFKELLATTAQLTQGGLSTEEATTALKGALSALIKPGKDAQKTLRSLGVPFGATALRAAGLTKTLMKLTRASELYPDELARAIPNIRAFTAVSALGQKELERVQETVALINKDIEKGTGLNAAFTAQQATFNNEMRRFRGELAIVGAEIGESLIPLIRILTSATKDFLEGTKLIANFFFGIISSGIEAFENPALFRSQVAGFGGGEGPEAAAFGGATTGGGESRKSEARLDVNVTVGTEGGATAAVKTETRGKISGLKTGVNNLPEAA